MGAICRSGSSDIRACLRFIPLTLLLACVGCGGSSPSKAPQSTSPEQVNIQLNQKSVNLLVEGQLQFTATVTGTNNTSVTWSVDSIAGGNASAGTITASGLYRAPNTPGTHTIVATSAADPTASASATVTVQAAITINPQTAGIVTGTTLQFAAQLPSQSSAAVTWSVDGIAGGNSSIGTINPTGLYTSPSQIGSHTVSASINSPKATASANITVFSISISPGGTLIFPAAQQQFSATVQGLSNSSVTWLVDGSPAGNAPSGTITTSGLYTAPSATGPHTIEAASVAYPSSGATVQVMVVNASSGSVLTYHNDDARDGAFTQETTLNPAVVNSSQFGKLRAYPVDGQIYGQPLYVSQLGINGGTHNVVYVATENDTVYAFDADGLQSSPLWSSSLGVPSPRNDTEGISPMIGITSTPVIDITTGTMYVLADTTGGFFLHALDITSGAEKFGGPVQVTGSVSGSGWDNSGGTITLEWQCYQRTGLAFNPATNLIYIGFGHCTHGWLFAYDKTSLQQKAVFNDTADGAGGGLWNSGGAPVIDDSNGNLFIMTGVDLDDPPSGYNDSFLHLDQNALTVLDFFQPDNAAYLALNDADLGSGSPVLMPSNSSSTPHEIIGGGKDGNIFVVNRDAMGSFSPNANNVIETVHTGVQQFDNIFATPAYWNGLLYVHCEGDVLRAFSWSNGQLSQQPVATGQPVLYTHGATVSLSSSGTSNGIVWEIDNSNYGSGPSILRAYDAMNIGNELYDSTQAGSRDTAGAALKFTSPTIAGGKVFVGTSNELDVYGLLNH